jgi:hypothetical protein
MQRLGTTIALGVALTAGPIIATPLQAMPVSQLGKVASQTTPLEQTQFYVFGGRHYCFYPGGWRGPGWYWCGYAWRRGFGWGGPQGWRGWHAGPGRPGHGVVHPGIGRPGSGPHPGVGAPPRRPGGAGPGLSRPGRPGSGSGATRPGGGGRGGQHHR